MIDLVDRPSSGCQDLHHPHHASHVELGNDDCQTLCSSLCGYLGYEHKFSEEWDKEGHINHLKRPTQLQTPDYNGLVASLDDFML